MTFGIRCFATSKNENLPPTADVLELHIKRVNYQCFVWGNALKAQANFPSPVGFGWHRINGYIQPQLMTLDAAPPALLKSVTCECKSSKCKGHCSCFAEGFPCTAVCACEGEDLCLNPHKLQQAFTTDSESESDI